MTSCPRSSKPQAGSRENTYSQSAAECAPLRGWNRVAAMDLPSLLQREQIDPTSLGPVAGFEENGILQLPVPGPRAFDLWQRLVGRVAETRYWPVVTAPNEPESLTSLAAALQGDPQNTFSLAASRDSILACAGGISFERWLQQERDPQFQARKFLRMAEQMEQFPGGAGMAGLYRQFAADWQKRSPWHFDPADFSWPQEPVSVPPPGKLHVLHTLTTDNRWAVGEQGTLLFVPTTAGWEVPAYLSFGGFNACPPPEVHVAMLKWLHDAYGGRLVALGQGTLEVLVDRRPASRAEALRLAVDFRTYAEAFLDVPDGNQPVGPIAACLMASNRWSFWWD
jgi:Domain of unknown function (DUF4253)